MALEAFAAAAAAAPSTHLFLNVSALNVAPAMFAQVQAALVALDSALETFLAREHETHEVRYRW